MVNSKEDDPRFSHIQSDPRFKKIKKSNQKVKIDNRFAHMFTDDKFTSVDFLDKRGKKEKEVSKEKLERFYDLEDDDKEDADDAASVEGDKETPSASLAAGEVEEEDSEDEESDGEPTDSSDDESSEEEDNLINNVDAWDQVHDAEIEEMEESTCRLSICNLNWDRMNASDIFVLLDSFIQSKGTIRSVEVFPSQYGLQRIEEERMKGPDITPIETEEEEFNEAALRKYQIERLKYYYAIVTTDAPDTADTLYSGLDGIEYQLSSSHLDLRYVPDEMEFSEQSPSSVCTELPNMACYQPPKFITSALQNSSVKLTWDETEQSRLRLTTRKFDEKELEGVDFSAYLASSESESEGEAEGGEIDMEKYKALLAGDDEEEDEIDQEMEITWTTGLEDNTGVMDEADKNEERQSVATHYKPDDKDDFFATDEVVDRPKEKKKTKKKKGMKEVETKEAAELALLMQDGETEKKHFNMKKILKNKAKEDDFNVDISDDRFSALKTSHLYSIDPTAPEYKETANTNALRTAQNASTNESSGVKSDSKQPIKPLDSTMSLVHKIKGKSANFTNKKSKLYSTKTIESTDEPKSKKSKRSNVDDSETGEFVKPKKSKKDKVEEDTSEFVKPKKLKKKKVKPQEGT